VRQHLCLLQSSCLVAGLRLLLKLLDIHQLQSCQCLTNPIASVFATPCVFGYIGHTDGMPEVRVFIKTLVKFCVKTVEIIIRINDLAVLVNSK
jgi:hypothetical protein